MADTFDVIAGEAKASFVDPHAAGAAFFSADSAMRPAVIHSMAGGQARIMAATEVHGIDEGTGLPKYVKTLPDSHDVDPDFRAGYFSALRESVREQLNNTEWRAVDAPDSDTKLDRRLSDDLNVLYRAQPDEAIRAWREHAPAGTQPPPFLDLQQVEQLSGGLDAAPGAERAHGDREVAADDRKTPYYEQIANRLIEQLEAGTAPFQKPWKPGELRLPHNPVSGNRYKGINSIFLEMQQRGDPR